VTDGEPAGFQQQRVLGTPDRSALPIAGDDDAAKESVTALLDRLGYDTVDAGATTASWRVQEGSPAYVLPYLSDPRLPWPRDPGKPADAKEIRTALEGARSRP
jgi:predicted dinucleotide-binding enzyme